MDLLRKNVYNTAMNYKSISSWFLIGVLSMFYAYPNYMGINPCLLCVICRWLLWISLVFVWLSFISHKYIYVAFSGLITSFVVGSTCLYLLLMQIEPDFCKTVHLGSCVEWNTFLYLPLQFWIVAFSAISAFFVYRAFSENSDMHLRD